MDSAPQVTSKERITVVGPDTYLLLDADGHPQAIPGMTYEDFMAAWKQLQQVNSRDRGPRYLVESVQIVGQAGSDHATLRFDITLRLMIDGSVDIPLGLADAILQDEPKFLSQPPDDSTADDKVSGRKDAGDVQNEYLDFDPAHGGFVAHVLGVAGARRQLSLNLLIPLGRDGAQSSLALNCPRASTAKMILDVESEITEATVTGGALLAREPLEKDKTRLTAVGMAGQFRMSWNTAAFESTELSTVLSATGAIRVSIDGRSVRTSARLSVRSYGGSFDRFRVRLPVGAKLIQERSGEDQKEPEYQIAIEEEEEIRGNSRGKGSPTRQTILVQLAEKRHGPVTIDLPTEQPLGLEDRDTAVELAGFEVLGAVRQFGDVALHVAEDWQLRWDAGQYIRQVDTTELDSTLQQPDTRAAFQYDRQPWALGVRVTPRESRIQVTPLYELEIFSDEARLKAHLTYQILGTRAFKFNVDLRGWERTMDPLESGGLVNRDQIHETPDGQLVLPLTQSSSRRAEITFFVRRALPRDNPRLSLPLPVAIADSVATGDLLVRGASGVELTTDLAGSTGLTSSPVTSDTDSSDDIDLRAARFRMLSKAVFEGNRIIRTREVTGQIDSQIELRDSHAEVTQRVDYTVQFEPIEELMFEIPAELQQYRPTIEISLSPAKIENGVGYGQPETVLSVISDLKRGERSGVEAARQVRIPLPEPQMGKVAIVIKYELVRPENLQPNISWTVPLIRPADGHFREIRASASAPRELDIGIDSSAATTSWKEIEPATRPASQRSVLYLTADRVEDQLPLVISAAGVNSPSTAMVDRTWLQTWLSGNMRQERAAFRFRSNGELISVELPPETSASMVEVLVDGQPADVDSSGAGRIVVRLSPVAGGQRDPITGTSTATHTLELRYQQMTSDRLITRRLLTPPRWVGASSLSEIYWQIVLPGELHIVGSPQQLAASSQWQWLGNYWGRRPTLSNSELEAWVGASSHQAPSAAQNEYLFSGLGPVATIEVVTAPRWLIVFLASGGVLAVVLSWLYVPVVRRTSIVITVTFLLAALAAAFPTPAMLLAQAAVLGIALAVLAVLIARFGNRSQQWALPSPAGSSHRQIMSRMESEIMPSMISAGTSTAPLHVPESER
jgi:hypothetical protein